MTQINYNERLDDYCKDNDYKSVKKLLKEQNHSKNPE